MALLLLRCRCSEAEQDPGTPCQDCLEKDIANDDTLTRCNDCINWHRDVEIQHIEYAAGGEACRISGDIRLDLPA